MTHYTIQAQTPSKKRGYQIITKGGKVRMIPNAAYMKWEKDAVIQLKIQKEIFETETITEPVAVECQIFRHTKRRIDLINALQSVHDALEKAGILENDFLIKSMDGSRMTLGVPLEEARAEIFIEIFKGE